MSIKKELLFLVCLTSACSIVAMEQDDANRLYRINAIAESLKNKLKFSSSVKIKIKEKDICHTGKFENVEYPFSGIIYGNKYTVIMDRLANQDFPITIPFRLNKLFASIKKKQAVKEILTYGVLGGLAAMVTEDAVTVVLDVVLGSTMAGIKAAATDNFKFIGDLSQDAIDSMESYEGVKEYCEMQVIESLESPTGYSIKSISDAESAARIEALVGYAKEKGYPYRRNNFIEQLISQPSLLPVQFQEQQGIIKLRHDAIKELERLLKEHNIANPENIISLYQKNITLPGVFAIRQNSGSKIFGYYLQRESELAQETKMDREKGCWQDAEDLIKNNKIIYHFLEPIRIDYICEDENGRKIIIEEYTFIDKSIQSFHQPQVVQPQHQGQEEQLQQPQLEPYWGLAISNNPQLDEQEELLLKIQTLKGKTDLLDKEYTLAQKLLQQSTTKEQKEKEELKIDILGKKMGRKEEKVVILGQKMKQQKELV